jgi:hypothetical protein
LGFCCQLVENLGPGLVILPFVCHHVVEANAPVFPDGGERVDVENLRSDK